MMSLNPTVQVFRWHPAWPPLVGQAVVAVVVFASGFGLGMFAELVWSAGGWLVAPAVFVWMLAGLLMFLGSGLFVVRGVLMQCFAFGGIVIVSVHRDGVWICESPEIDLFPKSVLIPFESVVQVRRERISRKKDCLRIVHGPEYKTETVEDVRHADLDALLAILAERCPNAVTRPTAPTEPRLPDGV